MNERYYDVTRQVAVCEFKLNNLVTTLSSLTVSKEAIKISADHEPAHSWWEIEVETEQIEVP